MVLRRIRFEVVQRGLGHGRGELLRAQAVAAAHHAGDLGLLGSRPFPSQGGNDVQVERFAVGAGFLGAVEAADDLGGVGQGLEEMSIQLSNLIPGQVRSVPKTLPVRDARPRLLDERFQDLVERVGLRLWC